MQYSNWSAMGLWDCGINGSNLSNTDAVLLNFDEKLLSAGNVRNSKYPIIQSGYQEIG